MKRFFGLIFFLLFAGVYVTNAQDKNTIDFKNITFEEALAESARTGKPVFIDCYTSWCAPCKWMEQHVFVNDSIYKFYNKHFVNFKIDMEKGEGVELRKKYDVASFPTYLFVDETGQIIHRTASRMEVGEFLKEGQRAVDPYSSFAFLKKEYENGNRSNELLFKYTLALNKVDRNVAEKVEGELRKQIEGQDLKNKQGWEIIRNLAKNEKDFLGKYLLENQKTFEQIGGEEAVGSVLNRLGVWTMYQLIREQNGEEFFNRLNKMKADPDAQNQRNVAMLEMEYYLTAQLPDSFVVVANRAMNGILEYNDVDLSFIARRAHRSGKENPDVLNTALVLARKAVELNPEEYSNQGTLADICFTVGLKEEGLKAARKARELANESTSKIQKIAQELVDKLEAL